MRSGERGGRERKKHVKGSCGGRGSEKDDRRETQAITIVRQSERSRDDGWNEVTNGLSRPMNILTPASLILHICKFCCTLSSHY